MECLEELESVWAQAGFDPETDKLICLWGLIGSWSLQFWCIWSLSQLEAQDGRALYYDFGQSWWHDDELILWSSGLCQMDAKSGTETLDSFEEHHCDLEKQLRWFYEMCPLLWEWGLPFCSCRISAWEARRKFHAWFDLGSRDGAWSSVWWKACNFGHTETEEVTYRSQMTQSFKCFQGKFTNCQSKAA